MAVCAISLASELAEEADQHACKECCNHPLDDKGQHEAIHLLHTQARLCYSNTCTPIMKVFAVLGLVITEKAMMLML